MLVEFHSGSSGMKSHEDRLPVFFSLKKPVNQNDIYRGNVNRQENPVQQNSVGTWVAHEEIIHRGGVHEL